MPLMEWSSKLDIGVEKMNDEHKVLLDLMNRLFDQAGSKATKPVLKATITALGNATVAHFQDEERYMQSIGYPDFERHRFIHVDLLKKFAEFQAKFESGPGEVGNDFFSFLKLWLSAHIQGIDRNYGEFSKKKAA